VNPATVPGEAVTISLVELEKLNNMLEDRGGGGEISDQWRGLIFCKSMKVPGHAKFRGKRTQPHTGKGAENKSGEPACIGARRPRSSQKPNSIPAKPAMHGGRKTPTSNRKKRRREGRHRILREKKGIPTRYKNATG